MQDTKKENKTNLLNKNDNEVKSDKTEKKVDKTAITDKVKSFFKAFVSDVKEHRWIYLYFTIIGIVFLLTRLIQITVLPKGMHIDEISMGYNTWTLAEFGTDRYGVSYPVYFANAGSGQSSLYVYTAVILSKIFGYSLFILRFVSVIFGAILLIFGTKAAYEMFGLKCSFIVAAIIDIMPLFLMSERWAFDCNAMLPMIVMVLYFFVKLLKTKKTRYAIATGIAAGVTLYSYVLAVMMLPVFLVLAVVYALIKKEISIKHIGVVFFSVVIVSIPIILYLYVVFGVLPEFQLGAVSFTEASAWRSSEIFWQDYGIKDILTNINTLTSYDKYDFMANDKFGVFYLNTLHFFEFEFSFSQLLLFASFVTLVVFAFYNMIKKKEFSYELLIIFYTIAVMYPMLFLEQLAIYRYNAVYFAFAIVLAYAFAKLWDNKRRVACILVALLYLYNFGSYSYYLFSGKFTEENAALAYFDNDLLEVCETFDDEKYSDSQIYVDYTATYNASLITLYGLRVPPDTIREEVENLDSKVMTYGNIHIGIPDIIDTDQKSVYVIRDINSITTFYTTETEQIDLYKTLIINNKAKELLMSLDVPYEVVNNYYIFEIS